MGKLEKVVVLSVLFVIAVILVVSLTMDNPIDKQHVSILGGGNKPAPETQLAAQPPANTPPVSAPGTAPAATTPPASTATPGALLSSNVDTGAAANATPAANVPAAQPTAALINQPAPSTPVAPAIPTGSISTTTDGLADSFVADMKFYTWKPGDTYRGIAQTYYGNWEKLTILRRANEGRRNVQPGEKILVPVFDPDAAAAAPTVAAADPAKATKPAKNAGAPVNASAPKGSTKDTAKKGNKAAATEKAPSGGGRIHVVKEGESLWKIAKAELGNGALWEKIYAANKDVMKSPEALKTGMKLRIP